MAQARQIESKIQLLVEGKDQLNFFEKLIEQLLFENIQIQDFGGVNELRGFLLGFVNMPNFHEFVRSIGIVRDAETSAEGAFQSVQSSLKLAKLSVPHNPQESTATRPRVTVLILPGDNRQGMLETLLCESFVNTPENCCIDDFFKCIEALRDISIKRPEKARAHAYLTTKSEPHVSVGVAAKKNYWDLNHNVFNNIHDFLNLIAATGLPKTGG